MWQFMQGSTAAAPAPPPAIKRFQEVKARLHRQLVEAIDISEITRWKPDKLQREVRALAQQLVVTSEETLSDADRERMLDELMEEVFGLGPLDPFMHDPTVSDILVNGPDNVWIERYGRLEQTDVVFADNEHLTQVIQRIASWVGRRVDETSPMVDARLPDGSRVNAVLPPLALDGPVLSIRRFGIRMGVEDMLNNGTMPEQVLQLLQAAVEAKINLLISGGTGAGKTTLLNALSRFVPGDERVVTIEDSAELHLSQPHVVRMECRPPNLEGLGEVTQRNLVRNALRMRPDRIIVGEVRGGEALDMLQAMNTGHEGSMGTIHANETRDALSRLEMMVTMAGFDVPVPVIRNYVASAIHLVVHLARLKGGARKVVRVSELIGLRKRKYYVMKDIFGFRQTGVYEGNAVGEFYAAGNVPTFMPRLTAGGLQLPRDLFAERVLYPTSRSPSKDMSSTKQMSSVRPGPGTTGSTEEQVDG